MRTSYDKDVIAWAAEQAALLRAGKFADIDIEHIAEEIEDVGKSEQRAFARRVTMLLAHLIRWQCQPERRGSSWQAALRIQRSAIARWLNRTSSLRPMLTDDDWVSEMWGDACQQASQEMQITFAMLPERCQWSMEQALDDAFFPDL